MRSIQPRPARLTCRWHREELFQWPWKVLSLRQGAEPDDKAAAQWDGGQVCLSSALVGEEAPPGSA